MTGTEMLERDPAAIEAEIVRTRAALHRKLHELERRLNPKTRVEEVRQKLNPGPYLGWAALVAVASGLLLSVAGWRRVNREW
jgi:hypothetical protein